MQKLLSLDVILVEDDRATSAAFARLLATIGAKVRCAATVAEALSLLSREPCLMVLDIMLPDGSGVDVLKAVRAAGLRSKVAVVSAVNRHNLLKDITSLRPDAIFSKPLDFDDFVTWFNSIALDLPEFCYKV
jgi:two-component system OmpR family response regulator